MFSFDSTIRYSETDAAGFLKYHNICNYFQDCSVFHSESLGVGVERLLKEQRAWILTRWQIDIIRRPAFGEKVRVSTWASCFDKCMGYRNFLMETQTGEMLAWADSAWVYLDIQKGRPVRAEGPLVEVYVPEKPLAGVDYDRSRIKAGEETSTYPSVEVHSRHMDTNGHMNNSQYIYLAMQYIPSDLALTRIRAEYKQAAVAGDRMTPAVSCRTKEGKQEYVVELKNNENRDYAMIEFTGMLNNKNGEADD